MVEQPRSLKRKVSPPPVRKVSENAGPRDSESRPTPLPAAVEAGQADVRDHVQYWCEELRRAQRPSLKQEPRLSLQAYRHLYERNQDANGHHFVIHQHDHPVSGVHYDLRLQFSKTSSLSFSIPYGVPGHPNSIRPNRMAIETRVHNVWNNLIESASHATGSLLIWDTGEYEVRPRPSKMCRSKVTDDELSAVSDHDESSNIPVTSLSEPEKLRLAFRDRHIHLRLHSTRLPKNYTLALRLPRQNYRGRQPRAPKRRRRKKSPAPKPVDPETTASDSEIDSSASISTALSSVAAEETDLKAAAAASDDEDRGEKEREDIRRTNAYPGAANDIGSVHQRQWFLSLDREQSGFVKARTGPEKGRWVRREIPDGELDGFEKFVVRGRDEERSIVTGRLAMEVMDDAGIRGYKGRKMWRAITE
ncbi:Hypothetical protein D9617_20g027360 [Elsinoe fawcettii]|nr:Hypothetical protein D9617_20g027360 [Elsinoe fawcettii]